MFEKRKTYEYITSIYVRKIMTNKKVGKNNAKFKE
jgi:hypothetical protein